jgi:hypothetical protein
MDTAKTSEYRRYSAGAVAIIAAFSLILLTQVSAAAAGEITVIYSAETHAMLHPCDCPDEPGGGLAERAAFLNSVAADRNTLLLLDGGGFSGGGIHDTYSAGRAVDSARTMKTIAAMGLMRYDAVAIGDDDLQYGASWLIHQAEEAGLPLICANCFNEDGSYLVLPYVIVRKGDNRFAITSVVTAERLFPIDTSIIIRDPLASLERIRREMRRFSDHQILISHLGEEETGALLRRAPGFLLAANAHRKLSVAPVTTMSGVPVMNFDLQGNSLSYAILGWRNRGLRLARSGWFPIDGKAGRDESVAAIIGEPPTTAAVAADAHTDANLQEIDEENRVYDLYIMSMCPFGIRALGELIELIRAFPQREWNVWFIGTVEGGLLSSLRGEEEVFDEKLWLGVKELYPFRYHEFLFLRAATPMQVLTTSLLEEMGFNVGRVRHWAEEMGADALRRHYIRSMSLNVEASPTLFVNNNRHDKPIGGGRLVRDECRAANPAPHFCSDYPECFENSDCLQTGKLGRCVTTEDGTRTRAVCEFRDDVEFVLTVLIADSAMNNPEKVIIGAAEELLPGTRANIVKFSSEEGQRLMARYRPATLPFFHFDKKVADAYRFPTISETLERVQCRNDGTVTGYTFREGVVAENYFPLREEIPGLIAIYADPLMPDINRVINVLLTNPDLARRTVLKPAVSTDPRGNSREVQDRLRNEEALRWLVIAAEFPRRYLPYLAKYAENPASSYWFNWLRPVGIKPKRLMARIDANQAIIDRYWEDFAQISHGEPMIIMINNRLKIAVSNERELERMLKSIR